MKRRRRPSGLTDPMTRRTLLRKSVIALAATTWASCVVGPDTGTPYGGSRIPLVGTLGMLPVGVDPTNPGILHETFVAGLSELGYQDGKNIRVYPAAVQVWTEVDPDVRFAKQAADVVARGVDVIVAYGPGNQAAAKAATRSIPIVIFSGVDPVETGLVQSLARPGGNVTGIAVDNAVLSAKRLDVLKEAFPTIARVVVFSGYESALERHHRAVEDAARALGLAFESVRARTDDEVPPALAAAAERGADSLIFLGTLPGRREVRAFAAAHRIPAIGSVATFAEMGGLMYYGEDQAWSARRAASYVVRILDGERAATLPMEPPTKFELVINLKAAREQRLTIAQSIMTRATRVIE